MTYHLISLRSLNEVILELS